MPLEPLHQIVSACLDRAAPALAEAGVTVARQIADVPAQALDQARVSEAITTMLSVAIAHAERGSSLRVTVKGERRTLMVLVKAAGRGLSPQEREALYEAGPPPGPLAGVRTTMKAHGGGAWANGMPGRGVTFYAIMAAPDLPPR